MIEDAEYQTISHRIDYLLKGFWHEYGDPRTESFPLMSSFGYLLVILGAWLLFVTVIGPRLMRYRAAFSLKPILLVYNLTMSLFNAYFCAYFFLNHNYGLWCFNFTFVPVSDMSPETLTKVFMHYIYFLSKMADLLDTIFFVLRKKQNQVSFLHLYHHTAVCLSGWIYYRMNGAFHVTVYHYVLWNTFVHTLMYTYYGLSVLGPVVRPYLWWKQYLTQLQIIQFVFIFVHGVAFCVLQSGYPLFFSVDIMYQATVYLWLFGRFYIRTYSNQKDIKSTSKVD